MTSHADVMPAARTSLARPDTQVILSYYQSSLADQPYMGDQETEQVDELNPSIGIDSSPLPPFTNGTRTKGDDLGSAAKHRRKHNDNMTSTENGTHYRRVAIVPLEVDTHKEQPLLAPGIATTTLPSSSRELVVEAQLAASALAVPPDSTLVPMHDIPFSSLTPSLPSTVTPTVPSIVRSSSFSAQADHSRKARTPSHTKSSSRDIGIVGTRRDSPRELARLAQDTPSNLKPPIFQTPAARSPSPQISLSADTSDSDSSARQIPSGVSYAPPAAMSASVEPMHSISPVMDGLTGYSQPRSALSIIAPSSRQQGISTSEQGQASPSSATSMSAAPSSYVHYQPGLHSKAGPLPPPPRAMFDIDFSAPPPPRPPRLRSPSPLTSKRVSGESMMPTVTLKLASKASTTSIHHQLQISSTPPSSNESSSSNDSDYSPEPEPVLTSIDVAINHTREGAFPPSTILVTPPERQQPLPDNTVRLVAEPLPKDQLPDLPTDSPDEVPPVFTQPIDDSRDSTTAPPPELRREHSWVSSSNDSTRLSLESGRHAFEDDVRPDLLQESHVPPPSIREMAPPSSFPRRGILTNLKRYSSLPRTPSTRSPRSPRMSIFTRSSSPESPPRSRIRARSPDAMHFKDVLAMKTPLERAIGYANKINELYMYDCGLGDWVVSMKERGSSRTRLVSTPTHPSERLLVPRARHTSRASISSEMTFPLRMDAYIATDLSLRDTDTLPSPNVPPPALPYPALAGVQPSISIRQSTMMGSPLSHTAPAGPKATGGFFASLGRNSSTRKDSTVHLNGHKPSLSSSHARLTKQPPAKSAPNPRPVQITSAPSVPGGPRALPNRMQRSRTLMLSSSPPSSESTSPSPPMRRRSNTLKRPSFFGRSPGPSPDPDNTPPAAAGTEFTRQVEKLAELLPHANKDILAGYLRRAGQDILAIGQYLEDEKNGTLRRD